MILFSFHSLALLGELFQSYAESDGKSMFDILQGFEHQLCRSFLCRNFRHFHCCGKTSPILRFLFPQPLQPKIGMRSYFITQDTEINILQLQRHVDRLNSD